MEPSRLLALALSRPQEALVTARALLESEPDAYHESVARQTMAIVLRDRGDVAAAIRELHTALSLARESGRPDRQTDVMATLGIALAWAGRTGQGLSLLDVAVAQARGVDAGRVLMRRAVVLRNLGRYQSALDDLNRALPLLRRSTDTVWEARSLQHRAEVHLAFGDTARAGADHISAEKLFAANGQELEYAKARQNRGRVAAARGDLPAALGYFDEAARRYAALDIVNPDLAIERCAALMAAGLASDAMREADAVAGVVGRRGGDALRAAELTFAAANAALYAADPVGASQRAERARRSFKVQGRPLWQTRAEFVLVRAQHATGQTTSRLLGRAERIAAQLDEFRDEDAPLAHLLAGRVSLALGRPAQAASHLDLVAGRRRRGPALTRSVGWLGRALQAEAQGNTRATLAACTRGLDTLDEHRLTLAATELRAHASAHGAELALIAQREALRGATTRGCSWHGVSDGAPQRSDTGRSSHLRTTTALRSYLRCGQSPACMTTHEPSEATPPSSTGNGAASNTRYVRAHCGLSETHQSRRRRSTSTNCSPGWAIRSWSS